MIFLTNSFKMAGVSFSITAYFLTMARKRPEFMASSSCLVSSSRGAADDLPGLTETKNHSNADLADLRLSDDIIDLLKSGRIHTFCFVNGGVRIL